MDNGGLDADTIHRLRNPIQELLDISDRFLRLSLDTFLSTTNASEDAYKESRENISQCFPDNEMLSYDQVKRKIGEMTGVTSVVTDMCHKSCVAFTGPYTDLKVCPKCGDSRYDTAILAHSGGKTKVSRQTFHTVPLGPQLQALWRSKEGAAAMRHCATRTAEILKEIEEKGSLDAWDDLYCGQDYLDAVRSGKIQDEDMFLMWSIDGAQLYLHKQSDCWIYIWIIGDIAPDARYKKAWIIFGSAIPGPNKPKTIDSFLYPGFHHVTVLQKEGLGIWDALRNMTFVSNLWIHLFNADGPGLAFVNGLCSHLGAYGCRLYCPVKGRRKDGTSTYYPAHLKPDNYTVLDCDHDDVDVTHLPGGSIEDYISNLKLVLSSRNQMSHAKNRTATGKIWHNMSSAPFD